MKHFCGVESLERLLILSGFMAVAVDSLFLLLKVLRF